MQAEFTIIFKQFVFEPINNKSIDFIKDSKGPGVSRLIL